MTTMTTMTTMNATTTTAKYELTDDDRAALAEIIGCGVDNATWTHVREWFASLPVVSREAAERALGPPTKEEVARLGQDFSDHRATTSEARDAYSLSRFTSRRRAMLDAAPVVEPPKSETPTPDPLADPSVSEISLAVDRYISYGCGARATIRNVLVGFVRDRRERRDRRGQASTAEPVDPTPTPQPAIDVAAELAKLREQIDQLIGRSRDEWAECRTIAVNLSQRVDWLFERVAALESAARQTPARPWWRWW